MATQAETQQVANKKLQTNLETTETDLANAVLLIQEKDSELANLKAQLDTLQAAHDEKHEELQKIKSIDPINITDHLGNHVTVYYPPFIDKKPQEDNQVVLPDLSAQADTAEKPVSAGFGISFPENPNKGDLYLRVDQLPSKLYKWNSVKWIEVDKNTVDHYNYDKEYIRHLIEKLRNGTYDYDLLTETEQEQIKEYLNGNPGKQ